MKVLVIGSGGREHAMCRALRKSPRLTHLYCINGNAGIAEDAACVSLNPDNHPAILQFVRDKGINLVIIGPEAPLVGGLSDYLTKERIPVFGCSQRAARIEGSKAFTKELCEKNDIPTAAYGRFTNADEAKKFVRENFPQNAKSVIKADGLAAGKGVIIAENHDEAFAAIDEMLVHKKFGKAGESIIIEEFLAGQEVSFFAISDGHTVIALGSAQDHKRAFDGDKGPNTGGMGTYSPTPIFNKALEEEVMRRIIRPAIAGLADMGSPYQGVIFAGLMIEDGEPKLLEFNARFGDPETQVLLARLESDFLDLCEMTAKRCLDKYEVQMSDKSAVCVVMAAKGYPDEYEKGTIIKGLDKAAEIEGVSILHAGTKKVDGEIVANGGRVLGITAIGDDFTQARKRAYEAIELIDWPEGFCRSDIGWQMKNT